MDLWYTAPVQQNYVKLRAQDDFYDAPMPSSDVADTSWFGKVTASLWNAKDTVVSKVSNSASETKSYLAEWLPSFLPSGTTNKVLANQNRISQPYVYDPNPQGNSGSPVDTVQFVLGSMLPGGFYATSSANRATVAPGATGGGLGTWFSGIGTWFSDKWAGLTGFASSTMFKIVALVVVIAVVTLFLMQYTQTKAARLAS